LDVVGLARKWNEMVERERGMIRGFVGTWKRKFRNRKLEVGNERDHLFLFRHLCLYKVYEGLINKGNQKLSSIEPL